MACFSIYIQFQNVVNIGLQRPFPAVKTNLLVVIQPVFPVLHYVMVGLTVKMVVTRLTVVSISSSSLCDGRDDCENGGDEANCGW